MKVLLINGSPHAKGCTWRALSEIQATLEAEGVESEIIHIGNKDIRGCIACLNCKKTGKCVFDDIVNETAEKFRDADGLVIGSPVYYASANSTAVAFMDRLFYSTPFDKAFKVGAAVSSARRGGNSATFDELNKYALKDSGEHIPLFEDVLRLIDGKVPLVVEIKSEGNWRETTKRTAKMLDDYKGLYCVESFNPGVLLWYRRNRPEIIRGQLSMDFFKHHSEFNPITNFVLTNLMCNFLSRPDFIAYDHRQKNQLSYRICRRLYNPENVAWTIKSPKELEKAGDVFGCFIFDSFLPKENK